MTIAGSDNSGGAGIQADLKTFMAQGCYGLSAIAAITAQNTEGFADYQAVSPGLLYEQIRASIGQCTPRSTKTGMLANVENIETVGRAIREFNLQNLVIDPVMKSSTGNELADKHYPEVLRDSLLTQAFAITPNRAEAELLTGIAIESYDDVQKAARRLFEMGVANVIIKGGHLDFDAQESVDTLFTGKTWRKFSVKKLDQGSFHGTGCTFSAALCAGIARGLEIEKAVENAKRYTYQAIVQRPLGAPPGLLHHDVKI